jgi:hypothetical protein
MYHYHFKKELKYYALVFILIIGFFTFLKALEPHGKYNGIIYAYDGITIKQPAVTAAPAQENHLPSGGGLTFKDEYEEYFGQDADVMRAIAKAESGQNSEKENITERDCSIGLFQINLAYGYCGGKKIHWDKIPGDSLEDKKAWLKDPDNNMIIAKFILATQGKQAWTVYQTGAYKEFL